MRQITRMAAIMVKRHIFMAWIHIKTVLCPFRKPRGRGETKRKVVSRAKRYSPILPAPKCLGVTRLGKAILLMRSLCFGWPRFNTDSDTLIIFWSSGPSPGINFLEAFNINDFHLRFTYTFSIHQVAFLDLTISVDENGYIITDLYRKPSSGNTIVHASSSHPAPG